MHHRVIPLSVSAYLLAAAVAAQTGRVLQLTTPATLGGTAVITIQHPASAGGHYFEALGSRPNSNAINLGMPNVFGLFRLDLPTYFSWQNGFLNNGTTTQISLPIANSAALLGAVLDTQAADVDPSGPAINLSDNDLELRIVLGICHVTMAQGTSLSPLDGDVDMHRVDDTSIATPINLGVPKFACQTINHRGVEGFVEGYSGSFTGTSHNSDIDSLSYRRIAKRTFNSGYQVVSLPNGYDISIVRDNTNRNRFSVMSYDRSTGVPSIVPGTSVVDTSATPPVGSTLRPYIAFSRDARFGCVIVHDQGTGAPPDRVLVFRTDASAPAIDVTATVQPSTAYFDGAQFFTDDFLIVAGNGGWYWTSATTPSTLQPLTLPNTGASNVAPTVAFPFSWRVSRDGEVAYFPAGTSTTRTEMDVYRVTDNGGTPLVTNFTRFAQQTGLAEFGFSAITPAATTDSPDGIKCAVSPDGTKLAVLAATTTNTVFPGLFVCTGAPNPALITVPGATYYSEVTFLSDTKVLFFAGPSRTAQDLYEYDVDAGAVTARTSVGDIVTRGQFWSLNKHWWYFIRSDAASTVNNIVAVSRKTGALKDITGNEFSAPSVPPRPVLHTGAIDTTNDPWPMLEMQIRRAPVGDFAYFAARRAVGGGAFEDANVFRFDIENGGQAEMLTNNTTTGPLSAIKQIESLTISRDGSHLAWAQRVGTSATSSEDVFHFHTSLRQMSASNPSGQTITDGSIWFTCDPPNGIVWSVGTGSTSVPLNSTRIQWAALSTSNPLPLTGPAVSNRFYQVLGTF